jgi:hypothetical protein
MTVSSSYSVFLSMEYVTSKFLFIINIYNQNRRKIKLIRTTAIKTPIRILFWFYNFFICGWLPMLLFVYFSYYNSTLPPSFPFVSLPPPTILINFAISLRRISLLALTSYSDLELIMPRMPPSFTKLIL